MKNNKNPVYKILKIQYNNLRSNNKKEKNMINSVELEVYQNEAEEDILEQFLTSTDMVYNVTNSDNPDKVIFTVKSKSEDQMRNFLYWLYRIMK